MEKKAPSASVEEFPFLEKQQFIEPVPYIVAKLPQKDLQQQYPAKPAGFTRFVCLSDTHTLTGALEVPDGDVLLHAGDFSSTGKPQEVQRFVEFLNALPHKHKIVIAGNHDLTFQEDYYKTHYKGFHGQQYNCKEIIKSLVGCCTYLLDQEVTVEGFRVYGSPWQPEFFDWAFNLPRGDPCKEKWDLIPANVDILITHGPPIGRGDLTDKRLHVGCEDLLEAIQQRVKPKIHLFGHIHEGYGVSYDGTTTYINASICTLTYQPTNAPIVFDLPNPKPALQNQQK